MATSLAARALAATLACLVGAVGLPVRAAAETTAHRDPAHDVGTIDAGNKIVVRRPNMTDPDVFRSRITHGPDRLVITLWVRRLAPGQDRGVNARIATPDRRFQLRALLRAHEIWLSRESSSRRVRCPGLRQFYNFDRKTIRIRIPRSCVGSPAWVRIGVVPWRSLHDLAENVAYDDALRRHMHDPSDTYFPQLTARLRRG